MQYEYKIDEQHALKMDEEDALARFRQQFYIPEKQIYMNGNSLGLLSKNSELMLHRVLDEWKQLGIRAWTDAEKPWFYYAEELGAMAAELVGAEPKEVVATGTTTINIHSLVSTFYKPAGKRNKIVADVLNFPTDIYALYGLIKMKGLNPDKHLVLCPSEDGRTLNEDTIVTYMSDEISVVLLPSVVYQSGQLLDIPYLTEKAHEREIIIGFDCSHSVGAIPHRFDEWGIDFAMWCSYKYLNSGPGSTAFMFLNKKHFDLEPLLAGWFGYVKHKQFDLLLEFEHEKSAGGWQISSPAILNAAALDGSLKIIKEAGIEPIREKSLRLTSYLIFLIQQNLMSTPYLFRISTPLEPGRRGGHIAIERDTEAWRIAQALRASGVVIDYRPPSTIRVAPVALYNTFHEVWQVVHSIKDIIDTKKYENYEQQRVSVS